MIIPLVKFIFGGIVSVNILLHLRIIKIMVVHITVLNSSSSFKIAAILPAILSKDVVKSVASAQNPGSKDHI